MEQRSSEARLDLSIHLLTVTGVMAGMAALVSVVDDSPRVAIVWLLVAQVIDGIDGPIARRWLSDTAKPKYDGYILDLVIDYVTCVLVPAFFMYRFNVVPQNAVGMATIAAVLGSSALWFSRTEIENEEHWFLGFPSSWNMIIPTLFIVSPRTDINVLICFGLSMLSLTDVQFPHVLKVKTFRRCTIAAMFAWSLLMILNSYMLPDTNNVLRYSMLIGPAWLCFVVVSRVFNNRDAN